MSLAEFIRDNTAPIVEEWESFARTFVPAAEGMSPLALRDHIHQILEFIIADIVSVQSDGEQLLKSRGEKPHGPYPSAAETHAALRHDGGFNLDQMVSEYRSLRASVVKLWSASCPIMSTDEARDLTRFHEAIDQALTESIHDYSHKLDLSRSLFLGILGHDLRNPLAAASMAAQLTLKLGGLSDNQTMLQNQIVLSIKRSSDIVVNLLDLTRSRLGTGLPVVRQPMDMGFTAREIVDEMRLIYPNREFQIKVTGEVEGVWDRPRVGQILSNLISNAVQYGFSSAPVAVRVEGMPREVALSVHNEGLPIRPEALGVIFNALAREQPEDDNTIPHPPSVNLGLGLYICKEIVTAHGGTIGVTSSERDGTRFTAHFPRQIT